MAQHKPITTRRVYAVCELYRLTHHVRASRMADDSNAPLSVPYAHVEHQREIRVVQHHLVYARCAHGISEKSGACSTLPT